MAFQRPLSPPWSISPSNQWSILEIKNGVEVAEHNLNNKSKHPNSKMIVFGRAADHVDIELQHESISRFHARIAFDKEGERPWLRDLSSTHGVFVNKRRLPAITIGRDETMSTTTGSRGVIIYPDDIIQFGASSRLFCIVGPEEFNRITGMPTIQHHKENTSNTSENILKHDAIDLLSNDDINDGHGVFLSDERIPESLRPEWEKLKVLQSKIENIENESERIRVKGDIDTLSVGQEKQLERNNERIATLKALIHSKEAELYLKIYPSCNYEQRKSEKIRADLDDEVDCYFDRTVSTDHKNFVELSDGGETVETLMVKWDDINKEKENVTSKLIILSQKETRLEHELNADGDIFFIENDLNLLRDTKQKLQQTQGILLKHLNDIEEMINVADPKLKKSSDGFSWLDPTSKSNVRSQITDSSVKISSHTTKETHTIGFSEKSRNHSVNPSTMILPSKRLKSSNNSSMTGTVALLAKTINSTTVHHHTGIQHQQRQEIRTENNGRPGKEANRSVEHQLDTWQAPKDQDGSGRTKLNEKFAGRY